MKECLLYNTIKDIQDGKYDEQDTTEEEDTDEPS